MPAAGKLEKCDDEFEYPVLALLDLLDVDDDSSIPFTSFSRTLFNYVCNLVSARVVIFVNLISYSLRGFFSGICVRILAD